MKSPAEMDIIQIDITNDCFNRCSNCSRFSGNTKNIYYMDFHTFKKACESIQAKSFKGMVGIMGGEPTLHPEFDKLIRYYDKVITTDTFYYGKKSCDVNEPIDDIMEYQTKNWDIGKPIKKRGLFTSFGPGYAKHFELIRNVFGYQCVNDHRGNIFHQAAMITRKELGIPDNEWIPLRDSCWLQNNWSASVTPKGAFFCEIAGALDMLLDGPGGWEIEPGWWKRTPKDFGDQLNWCELCSFCLKTPYAPAHENTDIVSPFWDQKLKELGSTKKRTIFDVSKYNQDDYKMCPNKKEPYLLEIASTKRIGKITSRFLSLKKIVMVVVCSGYADSLKETLPFNKSETDGIVVVTEEWDKETQKLCERFNVICHISSQRNLNGAFFNKGAMINEGIAVAKKIFDVSWILLSDADIILPAFFKETWSKKILNPGTLYYAERINVKKEDVVRYISNPLKIKSAVLEDPHLNKYPGGYFQLFNINADSLRGREKLYSEEFLSAGFVDGDFLSLWDRDRRYFTGVRLIHIEHGSLGTNWNGIDKKIYKGSYA